MAGWIKMALGMEVGLGPGHIVLDGTQLPLRKKEAESPIFDPFLLWPNGRPFQLLLRSCSTFYGKIGTKIQLMYLVACSARTHWRSLQHRENLHWEKRHKKGTHQEMR